MATITVNSLLELLTHIESKHPIDGIHIYRGITDAVLS
jgi:hypothetical protein